jgi:cell division protein ZipA
LAEIRWILLGLGLLLIGGIWWWGSRRSVQAPGNAALREPTAPGRPEAKAPLAESAAVAPVREWGVPPFEPLSIRTADFEGMAILDGPMLADEPIQFLELEPATVATMSPTSHASVAVAAPHRTPANLPAVVAPLVVAPLVVAPVTGAPVTAKSAPASNPENSDRIAAAPQAANSSEQQKIVSIRVCALGEERWPGAALLDALELHGLAHGRYQVFHRRHSDGRSIFCVASLVEPGTFDIANMAADEFRGVTLFAVLPGPVEPLLTVDELLSAAQGLAAELSGFVQDSKGNPLSPQRAGLLRDDVARFQASLPR